MRQTILDFTPEDLGLGGLLWTTGKVHAFIKAHFGVRFSHGGRCKLLDRLGLSFQRPDHRAREADPEAMDAWTNSEFPAIRAKAEAEDAVVMFADQVGARSDHLSGRTWGERGKTPVLARTGKRFGLNAMSAISTRGKRYFTIFPGKFDARTGVGHRQGRRDRAPFPALLRPAPQPRRAGQRRPETPARRQGHHHQGRAGRRDPLRAPQYPEAIRARRRLLPSPLHQIRSGHR